MLSTALIIAAEALAGYVDGLLDGKTFRRAVYSLDRKTRPAALKRSIAAACSGYGKAA